MGVDGSGKTTIAKALCRIIKNSKYLHLKPYILFLDKRTVIKNPHNKKKSSFIISFFRLISWLISYRVLLNLNINKKIYIFDRYAHDVLIDPLRYQNSLSKGLTKSILNFFPQPNLWIFLNPFLKTIKSRKTELSDIELKRQIYDYKYFFKAKKNVLYLNTANKKEVLIKKIVKKIINIKI